MATITAGISVTNDIASNSISVGESFDLLKANREDGMDTMISVSKILTSTNQVDLITAASVSTSHNYVYINNPSANAKEFIHVGIGNAGGGTPTDTEEIGRLYGGDWMFIPWTADTNEDIIVTPSTSTEMAIEYIVFS